MHIEHLAIWVKELEPMLNFYSKYFGASPGNKYTNAAKHFESYFLTFEGGPRLELMYMPSVPDTANDAYLQFTGFIHFAISVGSEDRVNVLSRQLQADGFELIEGPRWTGDGYYESVVLDPEKNRVEITI